MSCFSGSSNFVILDQVIKQTLGEVFERWYKSDQVDLRAEITTVFEDVLATYLYGKNVKDKTVKM